MTNEQLARLDASWSAAEMFIKDTFAKQSDLELLEFAHMHLNEPDLVAQSLVGQPGMQSLVKMASIPIFQELKRRIEVAALEA